MHLFHPAHDHWIHVPEFKDELKRLYLSNALVNLGAGMIGIFVPIYIYNLGYSITDVLLYFAFYWAASVFFVAYAAGWINAWYGPKHAIATSNVSMIISLFLLITIESVGWPIWTIALFTVFAADLGWIGTQTEISKLTDGSNSGKTFAKNFIIGKVAGAISPLVGGLLATFVDIKYSFVVALFFVVAAFVNILGGEEPVVRRQKLRMRKLRPKTLFPSMHAFMSVSTDFMAGANLWPLFIAAYIITGESAYASLGIMITVGQLIAMFVLYLAARYSDKKDGRKLLKYGVPFASAVHIARIFATNAASVFVINTAAINVAGFNRVPIYKGIYEQANKMEGFRITYFTFCIMIVDAMKLVIVMIILLLTGWVSEKIALQLVFAAAALFVLQALLYAKGSGHAKKK